MPRKITPESFDSTYETLLTRADSVLRAGASEFPVDFGDPKIAHQVRFRCYQYFKALKSSPARPDLVAMAQGLSLRLAGGALVFYRADYDSTADAIRAALRLPEVAPAPLAPLPASTLDSNLVALRNLRTKGSTN